MNDHYLKPQQLILQLPYFFRNSESSYQTSQGGRWRKACVRHFYWATTSTLSGIGEVKWAKFESFFWRIINKHKNFANTIYNKCSHGEILKSVWHTKGITHN